MMHIRLARLSANHHTFGTIERWLSMLAGITNLTVGCAFFFLPELSQFFWKHHVLQWSLSALVGTPPLLDRFIGAIIIGNGFGALWLSTEREWACVRPLALVAVVYGSLVALAVWYHLLYLQTAPAFWIYFWINLAFTIVYYLLFLYHDILPSLLKRGIGQKRRDAKSDPHTAVS